MVPPYGHITQPEHIIFPYLYCVYTTRMTCMAEPDQTVNIQMVNDSDDDSSDSGAKTAEESDADSDSDAVRERTQYVMYLTDDLQERLNDRYRRFNAKQALEGRPDAEKNRHFHDALVELALSHDEQLDEAIRDKIEQ